MGFDDGSIILNKEGAYRVGETISGRLEFELSDTKTFRGIYVEFTGYCKVHWTTSHSRRENDRTVHYTVVHESYEEYINMMCYLIGSKDGDHKLYPGKHTFPFQFQIPVQCPSSFEGTDGHVRYKIEVTCDRAFKFDQHKTAQVHVISPVDLNANPYCREPIEMEFNQSYCCWCMSAGNSEVMVKMPASGWCPNQVIPIEVSCNNNSNVEIKSLKIQINKETVFHAECEPDTHRERYTILEVKKGPIPGSTERNWVVEMELPDMDVPNLAGCRFIDVEYEFKVKIKTGACHENDEKFRQLIIGTIPLSGFVPQIEPSENQPVSHFQRRPIMNQPLPGNAPYPNGPNQNVPYPNGTNQNIPYPGPPPAMGINPPTNAPYPGANPPYPGANPPYPGANPPYPGANPPYPTAPGANPPYPTTPTNTPYPANPYPNPNPPYPTFGPDPPNKGPYPGPNVRNAPYETTNVGSNAPYPPSNAPYPTSMGPPNTGTSPYPVPNAVSNSPYPPSTSPYPPSSMPVTGTTLLKTGNYGFSAHGREKDATMPLLPPSAGVRSISPHAPPSAPSPSTPDDEGKKLADDYLPNSSPYNPEFIDKPEQK